MQLCNLTWPEVEKLGREIVVLYPIAALEQHSRHLPLQTDTLLCAAVARGIEAELPGETLLLPAQWLGASAHHLGMPGTLSAEFSTLSGAIVDPLRCLLLHGFTRLFVLNGHGGNGEVWRLALRQLRQEAPEALLCGADYWDLAGREIAGLLQGGRKTMGHACEVETSLMLHLHPELVRMGEIADDALEPSGPTSRGIWFPLDMRQQTKHGGNGEAGKATARTGRALLEVIVARGVEAVRALSSTPAPRRR